MSVWLAALLGLIQGLCEFLPVSSSGHLVLFQTILGSDVEHDYMLFDVLLHLGTLISVFICFWSDIKEMVIEFFRFLRDIKNHDVNKTPARRLVFMLLIATAPLVLVPLYNDLVESSFSSTIFVGVMLIVTAVLLVWADMSKRGKKNAANAKWTDALVVGLSQLVAVFPGLSRSGTTMAAGSLMGFSREFAVKFSFLLSIPTILGANIFKVSDALKTGMDASLILPYAVGIIVAAAAGVAAIKLVNYVAKKSNFRYFAFYCAGAGLITIILSLIL